jgi:hypothetical protein
MHESQQIAAERRDIGAQAHRTGAERHGNEDHLSGHEKSRQGLEHSSKTFRLAQQDHQLVAMDAMELGSGARVQEADERKVAALAYDMWRARGCPEGSPEQDWFQAQEELRSRH